MKQKGFGLLEILLVFAVLAIVSAVAFTIYNKVIEAKEAKAFMEAIDLTVAEVKSQFPTGRYENLSYIHWNPDSRPAKFFTDGGSGDHRYSLGGISGVVKASNSSMFVSGPRATHFSITVNRVPVKTCLLTAKKLIDKYGAVRFTSAYPIRKNTVQNNEENVMNACKSAANTLQMTIYAQ